MGTHPYSNATLWPEMAGVRGWHPQAADGVAWRQAGPRYDAGAKYVYPGRARDFARQAGGFPQPPTAGLRCARVYGARFPH